MFSYTKLKMIKETEQSCAWHIKLDELDEQAVLKEYVAPLPLPIFERISAIHDEHLAEILEWGKSESGYYVIEKYIEGVTLQDLLAGGKTFTQRETKDIMVQLCQGLERLHQANIIHRDVKPSNIMIDYAGTVTLIDYSAARLYAPENRRDTRMLGTEGYAAPEQYGFTQTDARADIYGVGAAMYELLTGQLPAGSIYAATELQKIIKKCLEFNPDDRFQSATELKQELKALRYRRAVRSGMIAAALLIILCGAYYMAQRIDAMATTVSPNTVAADIPLLKENPINLEYCVYQSEEHLNNTYFLNGEGEIKFATDIPWLTVDGKEVIDDSGILDFYPDAKFVTYTFPESSLMLRIRNDSEYYIENPIVRMTFHDFQVKGAARLPEDFSYDGHVNGIGTYQEINWEPQRFGSKIYKIAFHRSIILSDQARVTITIQADGFKDKEFTLPIKAHD